MNGLNFNLKKDLLHQKFDLKNKISYIHTTSYSIHAIHFTFHANNKDFIDLIQKIFPKAWRCNPSNDDINVYQTSPTHYGVSDDEFSDEVLQDCHFYNETIIQRDFIASSEENNYFLICSSLETDGIQNFLRAIVPLLLLKERKYIIHSSCVISNNKKETFLFLGHSGHGKTTISRLASPRLVLSDDMNLFDMNTNTICAAALGHQIHSNNSYDNSYSIKKIFWIVKDSRNEIIKMTRPQLTLYLMSSITNIFWNQLSNDQTQEIMADASVIAQNIEGYFLHFKKDESIWNLID